MGKISGFLEELGPFLGDLLKKRRISGRFSTFSIV